MYGLRILSNKEVESIFYLLSSTLNLFQKKCRMQKFKLSAILLLSLFAFQIKAQCPFDPTITGDTLLCPNATGQLTTQVYDSYQWYKRPLFGGPAVIVPGATNQVLMVDYSNDAGFYFSVEATDNGCTEMSPEVLVDGWLFLLPFTIIEGDYTIGGSGELVLCLGDTIFLISGMPYDTNLQWFDNGNPIAGANDDTLIVTTAGSYTFSGAPSLCPNFIQNQFIPSDVFVITCPTGIHEVQIQNLSISPNPANDLISFSLPGCENIEILDALGSLVRSESTEPGTSIQTIDISNLTPGIYILKGYGKDVIQSGRFLKK